jgi:predicted enzyme related to lactoylglutathione lyase
VSRFYEAVCGLAVAREEARSVVLESPAFQLVVVAISEEIAARITIGSPPVRREDTAVKLWFTVPGIAEARARAAEIGGVIDGPEREWRFEGRRVCDGHDPEGNVVQLREP